MFYWQGNNAKNFNYGLKIDLLAATTYYKTQTKETWNLKRSFAFFLIMKTNLWITTYLKIDFLYQQDILVERDFWTTTLCGYTMLQKQVQHFTSLLHLSFINRISKTGF